MPARNGEVGQDRLTCSGLPVRIAQACQDAVVLQSLASDNLILVPSGYPLARLRADRAATTARVRPYQARGPRPRKGRGDPKLLAPIIDAMLLAGNMTMRGILRELRRKASAACRGKDLRANVRARSYWLRKKGLIPERQPSST
jgi:hypothetical protein